MKKALKIGGILFLLLAIYLFNSFVYPFWSTNPNYADVERVFNKMQFPAEWQEIRSSENRGIAGRACPIESESACYHKSKTFRVPKNTEKALVERIIKSTGCPQVSVGESEPVGAPKYTSFKCSIEGLDVSAEITWHDEPETYITIRS